jgi:hypothetical protein
LKLICEIFELAIRPVFEHVNGAVGEQNRTTSDLSQNVANTSHFIESVGDSATEISTATHEAEVHGEEVAKAGQNVTEFAEKLKSRTAVLLGQAGHGRERAREKLPCNFTIEFDRRGVSVTAQVYEISLEGILVTGPQAALLTPNEMMKATIEGIGACSLRFGERSPAGVRAQFVSPICDTSTLLRMPWLKELPCSCRPAARSHKVVGSARFLAFHPTDGAALADLSDRISLALIARPKRLQLHASGKSVMRADTSGKRHFIARLKDKSLFSTRSTNLSA